MQAVIQAGGKGTRLRPYTTVLPKPLMPVGSKPVIELLLKWLRRNDVTEAFVTTGYLGAGILAPLLYGALLDHGSPRSVFYFTAAFTVLAIGAVACVPRHRAAR